MFTCAVDVNNVPPHLHVVPQGINKIQAASILDSWYTYQEEGGPWYQLRDFYTDGTLMWVGIDPRVDSPSPSTADLYDLICSRISSARFDNPITLFSEVTLELSAGCPTEGYVSDDLPDQDVGLGILEPMDTQPPQVVPDISEPVIEVLDHSSPEILPPVPEPNISVPTPAVQVSEPTPSPVPTQAPSSPDSTPVPPTSYADFSETATGFLEISEPSIEVTCSQDQITHLVGIVPLVFGRSAHSSDIAIPGDSSISRRHCSLQSVDGRLMVTDLGSSNGTYLGSVKLQPMVPTYCPPRSFIRLGVSILFVSDYEVQG